MMRTFVITKWCKSITDSGKDEYTKLSHDGLRYKFRLLDEDGVVYAYGYNSSENFAPLEQYMYAYGCTKIQYKNPVTGKYETL